MALNKRKTLEAAQKYVQRGAFDKALKEYQKLLKADPRDTNTRLKIGDLHFRRGDSKEAITTYAQVADEFARSGFDAKAVAIHKQILRIDTTCLDSRVALGELFHRMGLLSDALREFQAAIEICEQRELRREAFDLLKKVAALDPENVPNRLRLADLLVRQGLTTDAHEEYQALIEDSRSRSAWEVMARVAEQMGAAFPEEALPLDARAEALLELGKAEEAVQLLQGALPRFPEEISLRETLVKACEAAKNDAACQRVYREIAELYKRRGEDERAREILQRFVPVEPFGDEPDSSPSILLSEEFGNASPDTQSAEPAPAEAVAAQPSATSPEELLAEVRVSIEFGDLVAAEEKLDLLLQRHPDFAEARQLLEEIRSGSTLRPTSPDDDTSGSTGSPSAVSLETPSIVLENAAVPDTMPNIELSLVDEEDQDSRFASVAPPPDVLKAPSAPHPESLDDGLDELDLELDLDLEIVATGDDKATSKPPPIERFDGTESDPIESSKAPEPLELETTDPPEPPSGAPLELETTDPPEPPSGAPLELDSGLSPPLVSGETLDAVEIPMGATEAKEAGEADFDLAAELEDSTLGALTAGGRGGLQEVFSAFKRQIQAQIGEEESEVHYDLAIAYREMGLLEDAVGQLAVVRGSGGMGIEMYSLLATCLLELGRAEEAAAALQEALESLSGDDEALVSLRYDLGEALIAAGRSGEALDAFRKVAAVDPGHREVRARIEELG